MLERLYNPLICLYNAVFGSLYVVTRKVMIPLLFDCGVLDVAKAAFVFASHFLFGLVQLVVQLFATSTFVPVDYTQDGINWAAFWTAWQSLVCCACNDLCEFLVHLPIFPTLILGLIPTPNFLLIVPFIASNQVKDPKTWCLISNALNAAGTLVSLIIHLLFDILEALLTLSAVNFDRPNFRPLVNLLCAAVECAVRSVENSLQDFWDWLSPFEFKFQGWLCFIDTAACILLKAAGLALDIIVNFDQAIRYPNPLYPYWKAVVQPDLAEILNLISAPADFNYITVPPLNEAPTLFEIQSYYWDTNWTAIPGHRPGAGRVNPIYGKSRLNECLCTFIRRFVCDPTDNSTACFQFLDSTQASIVANLLSGFDFCCLPNAILRLLVDVLAGAYEMTLHFSAPPGVGQRGEVFFRFLDQQPTTTIWVGDLTEVAGCLLDIVTLIPVVGKCIKSAVKALVRWVLGLADLVLRVIIGLLSLAYFIPILHTEAGQPGCRDVFVTNSTATPCWANFITRAYAAVDFFVANNNALVNRSNPESLERCLCVILNNGFPVPPIPCPTCNIVDFPPYLNAQVFRHPNPHWRHGRLLKDDNDPLSRPFDPIATLRDMFAAPEHSDPFLTSQTSTRNPRMTPLLLYNSKLKTLNPWTLGKMIATNMNLISAEYGGSVGKFFGNSEIRSYLDIKKQNTLHEWETRMSCGKVFQESARLRATNYNQWRFNHFHHKYDALKQCPLDILEQKPIPLAARISKATIPLIEPGSHQFDDRIPLQPTDPPVFGCNPTPICFDLCCVVRTLLEFIVHVLNFTARFINGLAQGEDITVTGNDPDNKYPYFNGQSCDVGRECFESDVIQFLLKLFAPLKCVCQFLYLLIPVTLVGGRPDICCFIQRLGELAASIFQLLVNAITSLATGPQTDFAYFKEALFQRDIRELFDITRQVVECLCVLVRSVFPGNFSQEFVDAISFDPCCYLRSVWLTLVDIVQFALNIIIAIATITVAEESYCYWRLDLDRCGPNTNYHGDGTISSIGKSALTIIVFC